MITVKSKARKLTLEVSIPTKGTPSASQRSTVYNSTNGFIKIPGTNLQFCLNVIKPIRVDKKYKAPYPTVRFA